MRNTFDCAACSHPFHRLKFFLNIDCPFWPQRKEEMGNRNYKMAA
jgi:hypothetical protein